MHLRRSISAAAICAALGATLFATGTAGASPGGLKLMGVRHSLLGAHYLYSQTYKGLPVLGGYLARHVDAAGNVYAVTDARQTVAGDVATRPAVSRDRARSAAATRSPGAARSTVLAILPGSPARLVWSVVRTSTHTDTSTLVDARNGKVIRVENLIKEATGSGRVFDPNPVVTLQDQSLTDQDDADYGALQAAYRTVALTHLDGSGFLRGDFAYNALKKSAGPAFEPSLTFAYNRFDDRFEQVMAYYDVTQAQTYIQSLGFTDVNNEPQDLLPNQYRGDNSFYSPNKDTITLGIGGVDDAEDADVTWHEYGHAIQDAQVPGFGRGHEAGSIGEGFGDYWAVTVSEPVNGGYELPCVADWDSISYTSTVPHCLRRVDENLTLADQTGEVHDDGRIWSRALWDIHQKLGRTTADTIILESQFLFAPDTSFAAAAQATVDTARRLSGNRAANLCRQAFQDRGIAVT
jgi:Zn-dependent metalloprotease